MGRLATAIATVCWLLGTTMGTPLPDRGLTVEEAAWTTAADLPETRAYSGAASLPNGSVPVAGGVSGWVNPVPVLASTVRYEPATDRWHLGPPMSVERYAHCVTPYGDGFAAIGGLGKSGGNKLNTMEVLDLATNT